MRVDIRGVVWGASKLVAASMLTAAIIAQQTHLRLDVVPDAQCATEVTSIVEDADRRLWVAAFDCLLCDEGEGFFRVEFAPGPDGAAPHQISALCVARDGSLLAASFNGLWRVLRGEKVATWIPGSGKSAIWGVQPGAADQVWIGVGASLLRLSLRDGSLDPVPMGPRFPRSLKRSAKGIWSSNAEGLWFLGDSEGQWRCLDQVAAPDEMLTVRGDDAVVVLQGAIVRVTPDGSLARMCSGEPVSSQSPIAVVLPGGLFVLSRDTGQAYLLPEAGHSLEPLHASSEFFTDGSMMACVLAADRQGMIWVGGSRDGRNSVVRGVVLDGMASSELHDLQRDEQVKAIVGSGSGLWLGTNRGRLLRHEKGRCEVVEVPWPVTELSRGSAIQDVRVLRVAPDGQLVVALSRSLWRHDGEWHLVDDQDAEIRGAVFDAAGRLWVAWENVVVRASWQSIRDERPEWRSSAEPGLDLSVVHAGRSGGAWIAGQYGMIRKLDDEMQWSRFVELPLREGVEALVAGPNAGLWAMTCGRVWQIDETDMTVREFVANPYPDDLFLGIATLPSGDLLLLKQRDVLHLDPTGATRGCRIGCLQPVFGAPPRPAWVAPEGDCWTPSLRGIEHIASNFCLQGPWSGVVAGVRLRCGAKDQRFDIGDSELVMEVDGSAAPRVVPRIIDRSLDRPLEPRVFLRTAGADSMEMELDGVAIPPIGHYSVSCRFTVPSHGVREVQLGRLVTLPAPDRRHFLLVALLLCGSGFVVWRRKRSRERRVLRFDQISAAGDRAAHGLVDLAAAAVTVAETLRGILRAKHASVLVWREEGEAAGRVIAELGPACSTAVELAESCREKGLPVGESYYVACFGRHRHLLALLDGGGAPRIAIFLKSVRGVSAQEVERIDQVVQPILVSIRKHIWLHRLESDFAEKSSAFEMDAHDLRSPLTALSFAAGSIVDAAKQRTDGEVLRGAQEIEVLVERVVASLEGMLRNAAAVPGIELRKGNPVALAKSVVALMEVQARRKEVRIVGLGLEAVEEVWIDESWLRRVMENLLGNAIKYSPPGSEVRFTCSVDEQGWRLIVEDQGPGFSAGEIGSVFLPGITGSAPATAGEGKTGIGLWIVRQAVRSMRGKVRIGNRPSGGARIEIVLPRELPS